MFLEFISDLVSVGDVISVECGTEVVTGEVVKLTSQLVAIKVDGKLVIKKDEDITNVVIGGKQEESSAVSSDASSESTASTSSNSISSQVDTNPESGSNETIDVLGTKESSSDQVADLNVPDSVPGVKVVGFIDPKLLDKMGRHGIAIKSGDKKLRSLGKDLTALNELVADVHEMDNQNVVPARGEIERIFLDRNFGFISDGQNGRNVYFSLSQILDPNIKGAYALHSPVVYTISQGPRGMVAVGIHKPGKIKDLIKLATDLIKEGEDKKALYVVEHILQDYPSNFAADRLKAELTKKAPQPVVYKEYSNHYAKAKKYHLEKKYDLAIEFYLKALEKDEKTESAIKDLGMLYAFLYKSSNDTTEKDKHRKAAKDFMAQNVHRLPQNVSTWYYLENFYYSIQEFESFISIVDKLLGIEDIFQDDKRYTVLSLKQAAALVALKRTDEALEIINEVLDNNPDNLSAQRLKSVIDNLGENSGFDLDKIISAAEFENLSGGFTAFIEQTLDQYDEYAGVPTKTIEANDFTDKTLQGVRKIIGTAGRARPRERAKYLLTEAKLMLSIEPNNIRGLKSVLARYCTAMAQNNIAEAAHMDVIRFYFNEAFALETNTDSLSSQLSLYMLSHCLSSSQLSDAIGKNVTLDNALSSMLDGEYNPKKWDSILSMFLYNQEISAQITSRLYSNCDLKTKALYALQQFGVNIDSQSMTKDQFVEAWNSAREERLRDYTKTITKIVSLGDASGIEEAVSLLQSLQDIKPKWLCNLDAMRLTDILTNIEPALSNYIKSSGFRNQESNYNNANGQIRQLIDNIYETPTKLSFEAIMPLMMKVQNLLSKSFDTVITMSEPRITMKLLSAETVVDENNIVSLQIAVSNHKDSSPIREVSLKVDNTEDVNFVDDDNTLYNALEGGDEHIFKLRVKVSTNVIEDKATDILVVCKYKNADKFKKSESRLSLKLYSSEEFSPIENPYAPIADGGPVPIDSNMFFGREEFIGNIVNSIVASPSKQVIIYGQKRCGKSSVLNHLKKRLQDTGSMFCVFFSMGDIVQNLSEAAFYYKILSSIKQELTNLEFDGIDVIPQYEIPVYSVFKQEDEDNPLNSFMKYMIQFKLACKKTQGWEHKNLVVMIDEFTYLYTEIKNGHVSDSIMKQWKAVTQNERAQFSVVLVGQDVVPTFKKEDYARNAFGVIQDVRLTYLQESPARDLIIKPILDVNGESRYIGNAVTRIIDYTSRNPYYIQIFCSRLVEHMNRNKSISVTEADVIDVAQSFISGDQALEEDKFDNLIRAGETEDLQEFPEEDILAVLRQVAIGSKNIGYCNKSNIDALEDKERQDQILKNLAEREVLEQKGNDNYRIQVKLFQEWLLNH